MSVWKHAEQFDLEVAEPYRISLGEGNTPCVKSRSIGRSFGCDELYFKIESGNPTGSYKDRFAALAVSLMKSQDRHTCLATSSGNTGAALAAYCAAAGIRCRIAVVETAPLAKLQQMLAYGAEIERVRGFGTEAAVTRLVFERLSALAASPGVALQISAYRWSPEGMQGVESISHEIASEFPQGIDHVFSPAGGGGLTLAVCRGFEKSRLSPAVHCVQPDGNDTIATPLREGFASAQSVECTTAVSGLQVASVIDGTETLTACRRSGGTGFTVTDEEVYQTQKRLMQEEGIFCEPAGAVALAGWQSAVETGTIHRTSRSICLVTGIGFKDMASVEKINATAECPLIEIDDLFQS